MGSSSVFWQFIYVIKRQNVILYVPISVWIFFFWDRKKGFLEGGHANLVQKIILPIIPRSLQYLWAWNALLVVGSNMAATHEVAPDALPYFDQGYDDPGVREMVG